MFSDLVLESACAAAPSPNTTNQQLSSAASSAQRALHFGVPGAFVPAQQTGHHLSASAVLLASSER